MEQRLEIEYLPINNLKPYEGNAKKHPQKQIDQIKQSILELGFDDPVGIWGPDNEIVEGHGRIIAAKQLGMAEIPVVRLDHLSDDQRKAYGLIHNKLTMNSGFDKEKLEIELSQIESIDMQSFDFKLNDDIEIERTDLSDTFENTCAIEVTCEGEEEQQKLFNELTERGYVCQIV